MFFKALSLPLINRERLLILGVGGVLRLRRRQQDQYKVCKSIRTWQHPVNGQKNVLHN